MSKKIGCGLKCYVCGADEETTLHILRDYPIARMVWRHLGGPTNLHAFYSHNLKDWISSNLQHQEASGYPIWATLFCISSWWIWKCRNCLVFGRNHEVPQDIGGFIQVRYDETRRSIEKALGYANPEALHQREVVGVRWCHPPMEYYALNTDGAAKGSPGIAGGGVIIRDHRGGFVSAMAMYFGVCSSFKAEVMALCKGLELAQELQISKLQVSAR